MTARAWAGETLRVARPTSNGIDAGSVISRMTPASQANRRAVSPRR